MTQQQPNKPKRAAGRPRVRSPRGVWSASVAQSTAAILDAYAEEWRRLHPGGNSGRMLDVAGRHLVHTRFTPNQSAPAP